MSFPLDNDLTQDGIFSRSITVWQSKRGYRFGVDSVLLGIFARKSAAGMKVLDLGTGTGVVSLVLAFQTPHIETPKEIVAIEIQDQLADLAHKNVKANKLPVPIRVLQADFKKVHKHLGSERFDLIVSNPPYYGCSDGKHSPNDERTIARREIHASIQDVLAAASRLVCSGGYLALVYPASRLPRLLQALHRSPFQLSILQPVYARAGEEANLVLLLARQKTSKNLPPLTIFPPYVLADEAGTPTPEMELLLRRGF